MERLLEFECLQMSNARFAYTKKGQKKEKTEKKIPRLMRCCPDRYWVMSVGVNFRVMSVWHWFQGDEPIYILLYNMEMIYTACVMEQVQGTE